MKRRKYPEEIPEHIRRNTHNNNMRALAEGFQRDLLEKMTPAELRFKHIADLEHIKLESQYLITIISKGFIIKFYIVDFCDPIHKIIFEVDGGYHKTEDQQKKDIKRTRVLNALGYKVYRITNEEVYQGLSSAVLHKAYVENDISGG